jgi:hypothetical protein
MYQFNEWLINQDNLLPWVIKWQVELNNFDLTSLCTSNTWIIIKTWNIYDNWNIDLWAFVSSQIDWWWVYNKKYWNKSITLWLFIQWSDNNSAISLLDQLKLNTKWIELDFDVKVLNEYRTYKATVDNITVESFNRNDDSIDLEMTLLVTNWNWYVKEAISQFIRSQNTNFEAIVNNQWTYESFPKIVFICKATWNSLTWIEIYNKKLWDEVWDAVSILETITNNDIIEFDYVAKTVKLNQVEVPFFWPMTSMDVGFNVLSFNFTGTLNLDCYVLYNKNYL